MGERPATGWDGGVLEKFVAEAPRLLEFVDFVSTLSRLLLQPRVIAMLKFTKEVAAQSRRLTGGAGPHLALVSGKNPLASQFGPAEIFTLAVYDRLWDQYRARVSYVQAYERVINKHGATFFNDHIALRTLAAQVIS